MSKTTLTLLLTLAVAIKAVVAAKCASDDLGCQFCPTDLGPHLQCYSQKIGFDDMAAGDQTEPGYAEANFQNLWVTSPPANNLSTNTGRPRVMPVSMPNSAFLKAGQQASLSFSSEETAYPFGSLKQFYFACATPGVSPESSVQNPQACTVTVTATCQDILASSVGNPWSVYTGTFEYKPVTQVPGLNKVIPPTAMMLANFTAVTKPARAMEFCGLYKFSAKPKSGAFGAVNGAGVRLLIDDLVFNMYFGA